MTVLAIPADLEVARPPCERYDAASATYTTDTVPAQARTQLASALDLGGPRCATRAVQQLTGLAITRYVGLDLARLGDAVDALSGVQFCTPRAVVDASARAGRPHAGHDQPRRPAGHRLRAGGRRRGRPAAGRGPHRTPAAGAGRRARTRRCPSPGCSTCRGVAALRPASGTALTTDAADLDQVLALARSMRDLERGRRHVRRRAHRPRPGGPGLRAARHRRRRRVRRAAHRRPAARHRGRAQTRARARRTCTVQVANASDRPGLAGKIADTLRGLGFGIGDGHQRRPAHAADPHPLLPRPDGGRAAARRYRPRRDDRARPRRHRRAAARARPVVRRRRPRPDHYGRRSSGAAAAARARPGRAAPDGRPPFTSASSGHRA